MPCPLSAIFSLDRPNDGPENDPENITPKRVHPDAIDVRDRINKGRIVGTRVLASGPWISRGAGGAMQEGFSAVVPHSASARPARQMQSGARYSF